MPKTVVKTSLSYLPEHKQEELVAIKRIVCEHAETIEMIILFGSFGRGNWVEDEYVEDGVTYSYKSDYDLLLIFENIKEINPVKTKNHLDRLIRNSGEVETRVRMILHDMPYINHKLTIGSYFFVDIVKEGVMLYDSGNYKLAKSKKLSPEERKKYAQEDFEEWFESADDFYEGYVFYFEKTKYKNAAFMLHQATERFYHTILLVYTRYKPKLHDIEELGRQACDLDSRFCTVFPRNTDEEDRLFDLLLRAYIESRYSKKYKITKEELEYLAEKVKKLQSLTEKICKEKMEGMGGE